MNAGGVPNTCKSNEVYQKQKQLAAKESDKLSGGRVSNAWVTYLIQGDNS